LSLFNPADVAVTVIVPALVGNCKDVLAVPVESVTALVGVTTPPLLAANVTVTPATPLLFASTAFTEIGFGRVDPAAAVCFAPENVASFATGPAIPVAFVVALPTPSPDMVKV
jgi:hypothetical protein